MASAMVTSRTNVRWRGIFDQARCTHGCVRQAAATARTVAGTLLQDSHPRRYRSPEGSSSLMRVDCPYIVGEEGLFAAFSSRRTRRCCSRAATANGLPAWRWARRRRRARRPYRRGAPAGLSGGFELVGTSASIHRGATARAPRESPGAFPTAGLANTARGAIIGSCRSGRVGHQRFEGGVRHDRAQCRAGGVADRHRARVGDQASRARKPLDGDARRRPRRGAR